MAKIDTIIAAVPEISAKGSNGTRAQCSAQTREPAAPKRSSRWRNEDFMAASMTSGRVILLLLV